MAVQGLCIRSMGQKKINTEQEGEDIGQEKKEILLDSNRTACVIHFCCMSDGVSNEKR